MSTVAFGALSTRRELSDSRTSTSTQPPGVSSYVDVLAGLVPAEVLAINAIVVAATVAQQPGGHVQLAETGTYRWTFWLLLAVAAVLFVLGRRPAPTSAGARAQARQAGRPVVRWENWEWQDLIRIAIPPAAYVCWTMVEPSGVWSAVYPGLSSGMRLLIPLAGSVILAAVTKALASHADKKPSPAQRRAAFLPRPAPDSAPRPAPDSAPRPAPDSAPRPAPALAPDPHPAPALPATPPPTRPAPEDATGNETVPPPTPADNTNKSENPNNTDLADTELAESVPPWVY
ncbi:MAG: hypothetical protein ACLPKI_02315 [Streptosporangiaceae bacterium]